MNLTEEIKKTIDDMDYASMLSMWRNAPSGTELFQGESGDYFGKAMSVKRDLVGNAEHVRASKSIGWK